MHAVEMYQSGMDFPGDYTHCKHGDLTPSPPGTIPTQNPYTPHAVPLSISTHLSRTLMNQLTDPTNRTEPTDLLDGPDYAYGTPSEQIEAV